MSATSRRPSSSPSIPSPTSRAQISREIINGALTCPEAHEVEAKTLKGGDRSSESLTYGL